MAHPDPRQFRRRVLLCVTGLSPQVVTESLYALAIDRIAQERFLPTELRVITTSEGRQRALLSLLDSSTGAFHAFCRDYRLRTIRFDESMVETIGAEAGEPLSDILSPQDNVRAADAITRTIQRLTADSHCALHVSLAGGRKTMGFFAGYALSLFARPQDRLSHVLVNEPFDSIRQFFYPPPKPIILHGPTGRPVRTDEARITLAEIPIVRLGAGLPGRLVEGSTSYSEAVRSTELALYPPALTFDVKRRSVTFGAPGATLAEVRLQDQLFAFYLWLARRRKLRIESDGSIRVGKGMKPPEDLIQTYRAIQGRTRDSDRVVAMLRADADPRAGGTVEPPRVSWCRQKRSKLNQAIGKALGSAAFIYVVAATGPRNAKRFGLSLAPEQLFFTSWEFGGNTRS